MPPESTSELHVDKTTGEIKVQQGSGSGPIAHTEYYQPDAPKENIQGNYDDLVQLYTEKRRETPGTPEYEEFKLYERRRHVGHIGDVLQLSLANTEGTFAVHVEDLVGIESNVKGSYSTKIYVRGKTSPVMIIADAFELANTITRLRSGRE